MSLTLLDDVRAAVISNFKTVHDTYFPAMKVNYPNLNVVDLERQVDPFVSLYLDLSKLQRAALGEKELLVPGSLYVSFYFKENTGTKASSQYTDMLNNALGMKQVGFIYYREVRPMEIKTFPGWVGTMNHLMFDVNRSVTGS